VSGVSAVQESSPHPPFLVGRAEQLRQLEAVLACAARGQGRFVLLEGEAGIGKTSLAREVLARARIRRFRVLEARAYPVEGSLGYALIVSAIGPYLRGLEPARQSLLVRGLPDLGRLFPDLHLPPPEALGDAVLEKIRLLDAVARLLERTARDAPVIIFLDDLQWADPASLEMVHYLARSLPAWPVLLLATCTTEHRDHSHALRALLSSLRRAGLVEELTLSRLTGDESAALARNILGGEPPPELLAMLEARAAGIPLFAKAILHALLHAGGLRHTGDHWDFDPDAEAATPESVRGLILERLESLEPVDRRALDALAVSGEAAPHAVLLAATGMEEDLLLTSLDRLREAGLMTEQLDGLEIAYSVRHPLVQEVAYRELSERAGWRPHAGLPAAVERLHPTELNRLARHYQGAGSEADRGRTLEVLVAAAEQALTLYANDQAARHLSAALGLVRSGYRPDLLPHLLERLGEAWERLGETAAAIALWREAVAIRERASEVEPAARIHRMLAMAEGSRSNFQEAEAHLAAGLSLLRERQSTPEWIDLQLSRLITMRRRGDMVGITAAAAELPSLVVRAGSPRVAAEARLAEIAVLVARGDLESARGRAMSILASAEAAGEPLSALYAHNGLALVAIALGDHGNARRHLESSTGLARRLGAPTLEWFSRALMAFVDLLAGRWEAALSSARETVALARRAGRPRDRAGALTALSLVLSLRGDLAESGACLEEGRAALSEAASVDRSQIHLMTAQILLDLEAGKIGDGESISVVLSPSLTMAYLPSLSLSVAAEMQVAAGQIEAALATARRLVEMDIEGAWYPSALASRIEGLTRRALGDTEAARGCLQRSAEGFSALDLPFEAARARLEWAALATGDRMDAAPALQDSLAVFERLGARLYIQRARQALLALGLQPRMPRRANHGHDRLSRREREVAGLVAQGLSNAEVAEQLVLSTRTVTTHLERIYARLGIRSRAALARYVAETGSPHLADNNT
jgi:DNA-binding NarL/FixJ family response regulator